MPFHHVTAGLLYKGNYLNRSLSAGSDSEQLANISVEELDGKNESQSVEVGQEGWFAQLFNPMLMIVQIVICRSRL